MDVPNDGTLNKEMTEQHNNLESSEVLGPQTIQELPENTVEQETLSPSISNQENPLPSQLSANGSPAAYMSKDRPIKSLRIAGQRPFKTYNPVSPFPNSQYPLLIHTSYEKLPYTLSETITSLMQQQQPPQRQRTQPQQQQQQQQQQQLSQSQQQIYGDPGDYLRLNPQQQQQQHGLPNTLQQQQGLHNPLLGIDPSMGGYSYDDLDLVDPDNSLLRSDLLGTNESLIQQREQDLNIASLTASSSLGAIPNFILPNRSILNRSSINNMGLGNQDPLSMLFDTPMSFGSSSINPSSIGSISNTPFSQNTSLFQISGMSTPSNGNGRASSTSTMSSSASMTPTSSVINHYPVKQEADEGQATVPETPSPSSISSPTRSEAGAEGFGESKKDKLKRSVSESSTSSVTSPHDRPSTSRDDENGSEDSVKSEGSRDPAYLEKRRKNNESAKRSREARRTKEELVAFRVITLEEENMKLRAEIRLLDKELEELRQRLYCN